MALPTREDEEEGISVDETTSAKALPVTDDVVSRISILKFYR